MIDLDLDLEGLGKGQDPVPKSLWYSFVFSQQNLRVPVNPHVFEDFFLNTGFRTIKF